MQLVRFSGNVGCAIVLAAVVAGAALPCTGDEAAISISASLRQTQFMLGEPILLDCSVTNGLETTAALDTGIVGSAEWVTTELRDDRGKLVPPLPDNKSRKGGSLLVGKVVGPGRTYEYTLVVNQRVSPPRPGKYRLLVKARVPYRAPDVPASKAEETPVRTGTAENEWAHDLVVTPPDQRRLTGMADDLAKKITGGSLDPSGQEYLPIRVLFSMPPQYALSAWRAVADSSKIPHTARSVIVAQLQRVGSPTAADVLAGMWDYGVVTAREALTDLWHAGSPGIRKHVQGLFAARGQEIPKGTLVE